MIGVLSCIQLRLVVGPTGLHTAQSGDRNTRLQSQVPLSILGVVVKAGNCVSSTSLTALPFPPGVNKKLVLGRLVNVAATWPSF